MSTINGEDQLIVCTYNDEEARTTAKVISENLRKSGWRVKEPTPVTFEHDVFNVQVMVTKDAYKTAESVVTAARKLVDYLNEHKIVTAKKIVPFERNIPDSVIVIAIGSRSRTNEAS